MGTSIWKDGKLSCGDAKKLLLQLDYSVGADISPDELKAHLDTCPACRAEYEKLLSAHRLFCEAQPEVPALREAVLRRITDEKLEIAPKKPVRRHIPFGLIAAAILFAVCFSIYHIQSPGAAVKRSTDPSPMPQAGDLPALGETLSAGNGMSDAQTLQEKNDSKNLTDQTDSASPESDSSEESSSEKASDRTTVHLLYVPGSGANIPGAKNGGEETTFEAGTVLGTGSAGGQNSTLWTNQTAENAKKSLSLNTTQSTWMMLNYPVSNIFTFTQNAVDDNGSTFDIFPFLDESTLALLAAKPYPSAEKDTASTDSSAGTDANRGEAANDGGSDGFSDRGEDVADISVGIEPNGAAGAAEEADADADSDADAQAEAEALFERMSRRYPDRVSREAFDTVGGKVYRAFVAGLTDYESQYTEVGLFSFAASIVRSSSK